MQLSTAPVNDKISRLWPANRPVVAKQSSIPLGPSHIHDSPPCPAIAMPLIEVKMMCIGPWSLPEPTFDAVTLKVVLAPTWLDSAPPIRSAIGHERVWMAWLLVPSTSEESAKLAANAKVRLEQCFGRPTSMVTFGKVSLEPMPGWVQVAPSVTSEHVHPGPVGGVVTGVPTGRPMFNVSGAIEEVSKRLVASAATIALVAPAVVETVPATVMSVSPAA